MKSRNNRFRIAAATLLAIGLTACNGHDEFLTRSDGAISFDTPKTRSVIESATDMQEAGFSVWAWKSPADGGTASTVFGNGPIKVYYNNGWTYDETRYWQTGYTYHFYGIYPSNLTNASVSQDGTFTVTGFTPTTQSGDSFNTIDLMTASATGITYNGGPASPVSMNFQHELARVSFTVRAAQGVEAKVSNVSLYGMDTQGDFNRPATGTANWTNIDTPTTSNNPPFTNTNGGTVSAGTDLPLFENLLFIPQTANQVTIAFDLQRQGESTSTPVTGTLTTTRRWVAGQSYRYIITIESNVINFGGLEVADWHTSESNGNINIQ